MPLLAACSACTGMPAGVDLQKGTCSCPVLARPESAVAAGPDRPPRLARDAPTAGGRLARLWRAADWPFTSVHVQRHVAARGLAVATTDGGDLYWHAGRSGIDTSAMVPADLLPLLAGEGLATDRIALIGWPRGGTARCPWPAGSGLARVAGVVATSAALWQSAGDSAPGALDEGLDLAPNDVLASGTGRQGCRRVWTADQTTPSWWPTGRSRALPSAAATFDPWAHPEQCWTAHGSPMRWLRQRFTSDGSPGTSQPRWPVTAWACPTCPDGSWRRRGPLPR